MLVFLVFLIVVVGVIALLLFHQIVDEIAYSRVARDPDYARCVREQELEDLPS
jgi:hypothetical protein